MSNNHKVLIALIFGVVLGALGTRLYYLKKVDEAFDVLDAAPYSNSLSQYQRTLAISSDGSDCELLYRAHNVYNILKAESASLAERYSSAATNQAVRGFEEVLLRFEATHGTVLPEECNG